jgi:cobalt/nickel transport system permease protein
MSHIHFPDGILPIWLWVSGFIIMILIGTILIRSKKRSEISRKLPLIGIMCALMILGASVELIPIAYHINLTVISGILLGPSLIFLSTFIVNLILALFGHGGITVIGINSLILSLEGVLGFLFFHLFLRILKRMTPAIFLATVLALFISTLSMIGVIGLGKAHYEELIYQGQEGKIFEFRILEDKKIDLHKNYEINLSRFIKIILSLGSIGWCLEGLITTLILKYINRLRPDLLRIN